MYLLRFHMQDDDIPGIVRYHTYEVLKQEINNPAIRWAYLPYSMHMAGPREAIQHMIIRKNYGMHTACIAPQQAYHGTVGLHACPGPGRFLPGQCRYAVTSLSRQLLAWVGAEGCCHMELPGSPRDSCGQCAPTACAANTIVLEST